MMRLKVLLVIGALLGFGSSAMAQSGCGGQFAANQFCGTGGSQGLPGPRLIPAGGTTTIGGGTVLGNPTSALALPVATKDPVLGIPGTSVGSLSFGNATSGTVKLQPTTGALGSSVLTLPAVTDTLAGFLIANGGTGNNLTASNGGIVWSDASKLNILAGTATSRQMLQSGSSATPAWSTATWPATTVAGGLLTSAMLNTVTASVTPVLGVPGTSQGTLGFAGLTSGTATVTAQATAGSPTISLPNTTGTLADGATAPLVLSATTGNLTCPTCATSASSLTANQLVIGSGSQGTQSLGTLGTTTTVLHGNAAGAPTFGSVAISTDVSGLGTNVASALQNTLNASSGLVSFNGVLGTVQAGSILTNATGTAAGLTAGNVTTNANLTGPITSTGNATAIAAQTGTGSTFAMQAGPTFTGTVVAPIHAGGTGAASNLVLESTSGAGTTDFIAFQTASQSERMRILTGGSVGIGTSTPQSILHVNTNTVQNIPAIIAGYQLSLADSVVGGLQIDAFGAANPQISMRNAAGTAASKTATQSGAFLFILDAEGYSGSVYSGQSLWASQAAENWGATNRGAFASVQTTPIGSTSRAEAVRFQASGGFSIGTATDPGIGSLQVNANIFAPNLPTTTAALGAAICYTAATGQFQRDTNAGGCLVSSKRYKHDIEPIADGLAMVMASKPVTFVYNDDVGIKGQQVGFIAEQMATVSEDLIGRLDDGRVNSVRYMQYTAVLARAVQQLKAENDDLNRRLRRLEARFQ